MTEGLLSKRRLRVVLVGALVAVSIIRGATGQSLELGCPLKVKYISCHFEQDNHMLPSR